MTLRSLSPTAADVEFYTSAKMRRRVEEAAVLRGWTVSWDDGIPAFSAAPQLVEENSPDVPASSSPGG